jgi:hypothetical protein
MYNIKKNFKEMGLEGMDFTDLDQDRDQSKDIVNMVINLQVP